MRFRLTEKTLEHQLQLLMLRHYPAHPELVHYNSEEVPPRGREDILDHRPGLGEPAKLRRIQLMSDGRVRYQMKKAWSNDRWLFSSSL